MMVDLDVAAGTEFERDGGTYPPTFGQGVTQ